MRQTLTIEALLTWAYRDELPKAQCDGRWIAAAPAGGMDAVLRWGGDGAPDSVSDGRENAYGVMPDPYAETEPHPDAVAVAGAVAELAAMVIDLPEGWAPFEDCPGATFAEAAAQEALHRLTPRPALLIRKHAILGGCPDWGEGMVPVGRLMTGANGRVKWFRQITTEDSGGLPMSLEVDGFNAKAGRPYVDAYTRLVYEPEPAALALDRAEYQLWRAALDVLAEALAGGLIAHDILPCMRPWAPWVDGQGRAAEPRVLPSDGWQGETRAREPVWAEARKRRGRRALQKNAEAAQHGA